MPIIKENEFKYVCDDKDILTTLHVMLDPNYKDIVMARGICDTFRKTLLNLFCHDQPIDINRPISIKWIFNDKIGNLYNCMEHIFESWKYSELDDDCKVSSYVVPFNFKIFMHDLEHANSLGILNKDKVIQQLIESDCLKISNGELDTSDDPNLSENEVGFYIFSDKSNGLYKYDQIFTYLRLRLDLLNHFEREMKKALR
jgi:hypothetical protein